jgi:hypothetical protein
VALSVPAVSIGRGPEGDSGVTQPSKTALARWSSAALAGRQPSTVHLVITASVAAVMFVIGAAIMLLLRG